MCGCASGRTDKQSVESVGPSLNIIEYKKKGLPRKVSKRLCLIETICATFYPIREEHVTRKRKQAIKSQFPKFKILIVANSRNGIEHLSCVML